ncbi:indole-3-glycerol phosphate synthase TrpC [Vicingus serpentipes]|uniref:indole-3-glycerol-phosphate synthase n=1 Tax=Vicingus serpentipes TaxID=1926625 RepID=A0A5C6RPM6_9FLAO|nr:indole-3-glycerol phosphate synthase TrpC [Vicingus serpentipes]TXB64301.1 indole-3-glycerol phosphate synthase TrpC [Vicingus serpentipes]
MTILDEIIAFKRKEIEQRASTHPIKLLEQSIYFNSDCVSLKKYILRDDKSGIIAEFKRKSPSKGNINAYADVEKVTIGYMQAGASALSVLTDNHFFGGKNSDLITARKFNFCPILRKDFTISEYQIIEAKSIGADAILLIAAVLTKEEITRFSKLAFQLGMEILLEIHTQEELDKYIPEISLVGINNRNLKTFEVDYENSIRLANQLPENTVKIAESGINNPKKIMDLKAHGFDGFLIGENFMKTAEPEITAKKFIEQINLTRNVIA